MARPARGPGLGRVVPDRTGFLKWFDTELEIQILCAHFAMPTKDFLNATLALSVFIAAPAAHAADWPQYRGPNQDGVSAEKLALTQWPAAGLRQVWKVPTPGGFSSFAVADGKVFTVVRRMTEGNDLETCVALDGQTGKELWAAPLSLAKYDGGGDSGGGGDGPRSTPTYNAGRVYVFDSRLVLKCLDATKGQRIWRRDLVKENRGAVMPWQNAAAPVIEGDLVLVAGGGEGEALLGLDKKTGAVVWKGQNDKAAHATPVAATLLGVRQVIFFTQPGLVAVNPQTGAVFWRYPFPFHVSTATSPIVAGDLVYCSAGYEVGAGLVRVSREGEGWKATELWRKPRQLINHWSTPVAKDGYLYGMFSFKEFNKGPLKCVELVSGKEMWSQPGFGPGNVILVGGRLLVLGDKGELALVDASPAGYKEISRMPAVGGKCWSTPAYSNGRIYVRSTTEGVCLDATGK